jgi:hypothetical protein
MKLKRRFTLAKRQSVNYPGLEALRVYRCLGWLLKKEANNEYDNNERWYADILQGLGHRTACGFQPRLAPQCG